MTRSAFLCASLQPSSRLGAALVSSTVATPDSGHGGDFKELEHTLKKKCEQEGSLRAN
jgi:hypothetical protein